MLLGRFLLHAILTCLSAGANLSEACGVSGAGKREKGGKSPSSPRARLIFGSNLRSTRTTLGLSQQGLAARSGIQQSKIAQVEIGNVNLTIETMSRLADALGLPIAALFATGQEKL